MREGKEKKGMGCASETTLGQGVWEKEGFGVGKLEYVQGSPYL